VSGGEGNRSGGGRSFRVVQPEGWAKPRGYANGVAARGGETLYVAGQIGWDPVTEQLVSDDFVEQFNRALANVIAVVEAAGGRGEDLARVTAYVTDVAEYRVGAKEIGARWRARLGKHYPAMALVQVVALVHPGAKVEIEATAVLGETRGPR
jgi:enamine deaminase RidA (YjgF/YER057c/UK114 family)